VDGARGERRLPANDHAEEFLSKIAPINGKDSNSELLPESVNIWQVDEQPYKAPAKNAFLLRPLREVRKQDRETALGVDQCVWAATNKFTPLADDPSVAKFNLQEGEILVDPGDRRPDPRCLRVGQPSALRRQD